MIKKMNIEKILDFNYFLSVSSFVLFVDTYFIYFLNLSIKSIDFEIIKNNIGNIFIMLFLYLFLMAVVAKIFYWIINDISYKFQSKNKIDRSDYMFNDDVVALSIKTNNSVLYNYCVEYQKEIELIKKNRYLSFSLILIIMLNYLVSTENNISLVRIYEIFVDDSSLYVLFFNIIPIGTILFLVYSITLNNNELYYTYLPKDIQDQLQNDKNE